ALEVSAVHEQGGEYALISYEALVDDNNAQAAISLVKAPDQPTLATYRGWMLRPQQYTRLYEALASINIVLINNPQAYQHCHYLPQSYHLIAPHTAKTVWLKYDEHFSLDKVTALLSEFGSQPIIVKDYVKSRKHEWTEACFIPSAADKLTALRVIETFLSRQGEDLNEGIVLREYVELEPLTKHSKSDMPLTKEYRLFFLDGKLINTCEYWEEGTYQSEEILLEQFINIATKIESRFFTMDIAKTVAGEWVIIELGDGQVAGLPDRANVADFYQALLTQ
ncbi:MAG: ATP-grasp domain-containing protein, partial [Acidobacteriota bacterium]